MSSKGLAYSEPLVAPQRTPAYGEGQLGYEEPSAEVEEQLGRRVHLSLALAIFAPVVAAYGAIGYGLYLAAGAIF